MGGPVFNVGRSQPLVRRLEAVRRYFAMQLDLRRTWLARAIREGVPEPGMYEFRLDVEWFEAHMEALDEAIAICRARNST